MFLSLLKIVWGIVYRNLCNIELDIGNWVPFYTILYYMTIIYYWFSTLFLLYASLPLMAIERWQYLSSVAIQ